MKNNSLWIKGFKSFFVIKFSFVIPRNEESPQVARQTKLPIFVEQLVEIFPSSG